MDDGDEVSLIGIAVTAISTLIATLRRQTKMVHDIAHHRAPFRVDGQNGTGCDRPCMEDATSGRAFPIDHLGADLV